MFQIGVSSGPEPMHRSTIYVGTEYLHVLCPIHDHVLFAIIPYLYGGMYMYFEQVVSVLYIFRIGICIITYI